MAQLVVERELLPHGDTCSLGERREAARILAEDAFAVVAERMRRRRAGSAVPAPACSGYPFSFDGRADTLRYEAQTSPAYEFMLALSLAGEHDGVDVSNDDRKLFEELCASAAAVYLGAAHSEPVGHWAFGSPRWSGPTGFRGAVQELCERLGEGRSFRCQFDAAHVKEDGLDVVAWREFEDGLPCKLIILGQCATGAKWWTKLGDLPHGKGWFEQYMDVPPIATPVSSFFIPFAIDCDGLEHVRSRGILLFERFRIASLARALASDHAERCARRAACLLRQVVC